ncbi:MAG: hypothetical protein E7643_03635 [Ruminococcaceae bacterium]|nr:hypothetical protein [Oscillospiraceae bacterium]
MNNQFNIKEYFTENYNLGNKPTVSKFHITFMNIILILVSVALIFVFAPVGLIGTALFVVLWIVLPILKINKQKAAAAEWQKNFNIRSQTWDTEFDKFHAARIAKMNPMDLAIKKFGLESEDGMDGGLRLGVAKWSDRNATEMNNFPAEPFPVYGHKYDGFYRLYCKDGKTRTDSNEITWFFFGKDQIYVYTLNYKLSEPDRKRDNDLQFFYSDIVSVQTGSSTVELDKNKGFGKKTESIDAEEFILTVPGDKIRYAFTSSDRVNASIQGMKKLITAKKTAALNVRQAPMV